MIMAIAQQCNDSKITCTSPGFGIAASADGKQYPYVFPMPPRATGRKRPAAVDYAKKQLGGSLKDKKIAYLFYDNPAGPGAAGGAARIPCERARASNWNELRGAAARALDVNCAQALDIAQEKPA